jgi:tetratricopeptide (TPR) repeat protein
VRSESFQAGCNRYCCAPKPGGARQIAWLTLSTGKLLASSAVRLFIERAKAVKRDFVINALDKEELLEAGMHFERTLGIFRGLGRANAWTLLQLGITAIYEGRLRSARKFLQKALTIFRETGAKNGIADTLCELARLARLQARARRGALVPE